MDWCAAKDILHHLELINCYYKLTAAFQQNEGAFIWKKFIGFKKYIFDFHLNVQYNTTEYLIENILRY